MASSEWKSPRKVEEEKRQYRRSRFEAYMQQADEGKIERAMAIAAFTEEIEYAMEIEDGTNIQPAPTLP